MWIADWVRKGKSARNSPGAPRNPKSEEQVPRTLFKLRVGKNPAMGIIFVADLVEVGDNIWNR